MDQTIFLTTILTPTPLIKLNAQNKNKDCELDFIKKSIFPLTLCFCYAIKENDFLTDITESPVTLSIYAYCLIYYGRYMARENLQKKIDQEVVTMMQHVFHLLIIGHGIYNKITSNPAQQTKGPEGAIENSTSTLQLFLRNAYHTWFILFAYYQEHYNDKPLYQYHMNEIDVFEILQASTHEPDILPLISNLYNKNNKNYDCDPIFNCLEIKLKQINLKMKQIVHFL